MNRQNQQCVTEFPKKVKSICFPKSALCITKRAHVPSSLKAARVKETVFSSSWHCSFPVWMKIWSLQLLPGCYPSICSGASLVHLLDPFLLIIFCSTLFFFQHNPPQEPHWLSPPTHTGRWCCTDGGLHFRWELHQRFQRQRKELMSGQQ